MELNFRKACIYFVSLFIGYRANNVNLRLVSDCTCLGDTVTYECTTMGPGSTVFTIGNASNCEIILRHSLFVPDGTFGQCLNVPATGNSSRFENNLYTSRLTVSVNMNMTGNSINCYHDNGSSQIIIGSVSPILTTQAESFSPPNYTSATFRQNELKIDWSPLTLQCASLFYNINDTLNCGVCTTQNTSTSAVCRDYTTRSVDNFCEFKIQTVVCGNIKGDSNTLFINLRVPDAPVIQVTPTYSRNNRDSVLRVLSTKVLVVDSFNISNGVDGSAVNYTILYRDSTFGRLCGSAIIPASSCTSGECNVVFEINLSNCSRTTTITVIVFATNVVGRGLESNPATRDGVNNEVIVEVDSTQMNIICTFLNQPYSVPKLCSANITYGMDCEKHLDVYSSRTSIGKILQIPVKLDTVDGIETYCLLVNATINNVTLLIERDLQISTVSTDNINTILWPIIISVLTFFLLSLTVIVIGRRKLRDKKLTYKVMLSIKNRPGSLARALEVFKNQRINIYGVNTHLYHLDYNPRVDSGHVMNHLYCYCSQDKIDFIRTRFQAEIRVVKDTGPANMKFIAAKIVVKDKTGALWRVLNAIGDRGINLVGINSRSRALAGDENMDCFISCTCSEKEIKSVLQNINELEVVTQCSLPEILLKPHMRRRVIEHLVRDKIDALIYVMEKFSELKINLGHVNYNYIAYELESISGFRNVYAECFIDEDSRNIFLGFLKENYGAVVAEYVENDACKIRRTTDPNYCIIKVSVVDEQGSLCRALKSFSEHRDIVQFIGINSLKSEYEYNVMVEYQEYHITFISSSAEEVYLMEKLQATGVITFDQHSTPILQEQSEYEQDYDDILRTRTLQLLIKVEAGALARCINVFSDQKIVINGINVHSPCMNNDEYCIECVCTNEVKYKLIRKIWDLGAKFVTSLPVERVPESLRLADSECIINFSVEPGSCTCTSVLQLFGELNVDIRRINDTNIMRLCDKQEYVECYCTKEEQAKLIDTLKGIPGITDVTPLPKIHKFYRQNVADPRYAIIRISVVSEHEGGLLIRALKEFFKHKIEIIAINTPATPIDHVTVVYRRYQMEFLSSIKDEQQLKYKLQASGFVIDIKTLDALHQNVNDTPL